MRELPTVKTANAECCSPAIREQQCSPGTDARDAAELSEAAHLFRTLGDPTRLAILRQLRTQEEICACDFMACCEVAQPTVSHHLKVLREAGLVAAEKRGIWMYYRINSKALDRLRRYWP